METQEEPKVIERPSIGATLRSLPFAIKIVYQADPTSTILLSAASVLEGPMIALGVIGLKYLLDALTAGESERAIFWAGIIVAGMLIQSGMSYIRELYSDLLRFRTDVALKQKNLEYLLRLPYAVLEDPHFHELASTFDRRSHVIVNLQQTGMWILRTFFGLLGLFAVFAFLPWPVIALIVASQILLFFLYRRAAEWNWSVVSFESREGRRAAYREQILSHPSTLLPTKALGLAEPFLASWKAVISEILGLRIKEAKAGATAAGLSEFLGAASFALGLWMTVSDVLRGAISVSVAAVFISSFNRFSDKLSGLVSNIKWLMKEASVFPRLKEYFSYELESEKGKGISKDPLRVSFENVWFRYPGTETDILKGVTFSFTEGDHLAFVGLNGAGKTTLLKLLMRVYEPTQGKILVNGVNLSSMKPAEWRKVLAVLTQDSPAYDDVLREQVRYGDAVHPLDTKRLKLAIETSGLDDVASVFPKGLETHAGRRYSMPEDEAIELSGGQKQILAIARTMYRQARIYILDEPTSAVDAEKEESFFSILPEALQSQAVIFVSHRFSTLRRAERIIVIDDGRIIEDGTHEELLLQKGRYAELFQLQAKMYQ